MKNELENRDMVTSKEFKKAVKKINIFLFLICGTILYMWFFK